MKTAACVAVLSCAAVLAQQPRVENARMETTLGSVCSMRRTVAVRRAAFADAAAMPKDVIARFNAITMPAQ